MSDEERARYLAPVGIWRDLASAAQKDIIEALASVRAEEREACARIADKGVFTLSVPGVAAAIRAQAVKDKVE